MHNYVLKIHIHEFLYSNKSDYKQTSVM